MTSNTKHYNNLLPNPCGSTSSDTTKRGVDKFIKRKCPFLISNFSTRSVLKDSRKLEIATRTSKFKIDVTCLQEHRIIHKHEITKESLYGNFLLTCSATKSSVNAAIRGVGFLLSRRAMNSLINVEKINERIAILTLEGNPRTTIINCYSPTKVSSETEIENFYQSLSVTVTQIPVHNMVIVGGDFNAKIRLSETIYSFNLSINCNGQMLCDMMVQHGLVALNTRSMKSKKKLWTFMYPNGEKAQLDYILGRKRGKNSFKNCQSYNSFDTIFSDHRIVSCKVNISYRQSKRSPKSLLSKKDWKAVLCDNNLQNQYDVDVYNRYKALSEQMTEASTDDRYKALIAVNAEVATNILPKNRN